MSIQLRPTMLDDIDFVLNAEGHPANRLFVGQWTKAQHIAALTNPDIAHHVIERDNNGQRVGYLILAGLSQPHHSIEFRRIVVTEKGNGYGREALRLVKKLVFETYHAHRLWLDVRIHNLRAQHLYQAEGFVIEGTVRECIRVEDHFESLLLMSMLASEYQEAEQSLAADQERRAGKLVGEPHAQVAPTFLGD